MDGRLGRRELLMGGVGAVAGAYAPTTPKRYDGRFIAGEGDVGYLELLDISYRMMWPNGELQNISMLYSPDWNGFVEGPTWGAWWIQNSYGPSYCGMPFFTEPYRSFLQNSQDLWFSQMGDGKRKGAHDWVAPDGCLCDAASPSWVVYKQGDGRIDIHDWGMEFTAAGIVMQAEFLLISRDEGAIARYLPMLERCADFVESRRDPANDLFLAGAAGNLLAPSYAGHRRPDGSYGMAYLAGLSVTYIAALDRLSELERLAGRPVQAGRYADRCVRARRGLARLANPDGSLIKYLDPNGTRHGVFGAPKHGYFEAVCNHDAVAFRVVPDAQARRIYSAMGTVPGLRPHGVVITNHPSLDDMYTEPTGLWQFGTWVNGGHWTTCEARMIMADFRMGGFGAARKAMEHILSFARIFRTDNPLVQFGKAVYQPQHPINCVYDTWGAPLGMLRGLFEYLYSADTLTLVPHVPPGITRLEQRFPVVWGRKRIHLDVAGTGDISAVLVNGKAWRAFDAANVRLSYADLPDNARVSIALGDGRPARSRTSSASMPDTRKPRGRGPLDPTRFPGLDGVPFARIARFHDALRRNGLDQTPEGAHAALILSYVGAMHERSLLHSAGKLPALPEASERAADQSYVDAAKRLADGLARTVERADSRSTAGEPTVYSIWQETKA